MNATNDIDKVTQRRLKAQQTLEAAARAELARKVDAELESHPKLKKLEVGLGKVRNQLHRKRVVAKRKEFAIKIRQERLQSIPKEIREINLEKAKVERQIAQLSEAETRLINQKDELRDQITRRLMASGEVLPYMPEQPAA